MINKKRGHLPSFFILTLTIICSKLHFSFNFDSRKSGEPLSLPEGFVESGCL